MGWNYAQLRRIENGICVRCGSEMATHPLLTCETCRDRKRAEQMELYRRKKIDAVASITDKRRLMKLLDYLGCDVKPELAVKLLKLEKTSKQRAIFFRYLFDSRRWTVGKFIDRTTATDDLNDLVVDCLNYAQTIPDPIAEMRDLQQERQIETHDRSITALAMAQMDGMTSDDFAAVNHLY